MLVTSRQIYFKNIIASVANARVLILTFKKE